MLLNLGLCRIADTFQIVSYGFLCLLGILSNFGIPHSYWLYDIQRAPGLDRTSCRAYSVIDRSRSLCTGCSISYRKLL